MIRFAASQVSTSSDDLVSNDELFLLRLEQ